MKQFTITALLLLCYLFSVAQSSVCVGNSCDVADNVPTIQNMLPTLSGPTSIPVFRASGYMATGGCGSSSLCPDDRILYTLSNVPSGSTVSWHASGYVRIIETLGNAVYVIMTYMGSGTLYAMVSKHGYNTEIVSINISSYKPTGVFDIQEQGCFPHYWKFGIYPPNCWGDPSSADNDPCDNYQYVWSVSGTTIKSGQGQPYVQLNPTSNMITLSCTVTYKGYQWSVSESFDGSMYCGGFFAQNESTIYPNPSKDKVTVEWPEDFNAVAYTVIDSQGVELDRQQLMENSKLQQIDINQWRKGIYYIKLTSKEGKQLQFRLIKD